MYASLGIEFDKVKGLNKISQQVADALKDVGLVKVKPEIVKKEWASAIKQITGQFANIDTSPFFKTILDKNLSPEQRSDYIVNYSKQLDKLSNYINSENPAFNMDFLNNLNGNQFSTLLNNFFNIDLEANNAKEQINSLLDSIKNVKNITADTGSLIGENISGNIESGVNKAKTEIELLEKALDNVIKKQQEFQKYKKYLVSEKEARSYIDKNGFNSDEGQNYLARLYSLNPNALSIDEKNFINNYLKDNPSTKIKQIIQATKMQLEEFNRLKNIQKDLIGSNNTGDKSDAPLINITGNNENEIESFNAEQEELEKLRLKIEEVKTALDDKTKAIVTEQGQMSTSVKAEIDDLTELINQLSSVQNKLKEDFSLNINKNLDFSSLDASSIASMIQNGNFTQASTTIADVLKGIVEANQLILKYSSFDERESNITSSGASYGSQARFANKRNLRERAVFFNPKTGAYSNPYVYDQQSQVGGSFLSALRESGKYTAQMHTHPEKTATFSSPDLKSYANAFKNGIVSQFVLALDDIAEFDVGKFMSKASRLDLMNIAEEIERSYKALKYAEYPSYTSNFTKKNDIYKRLQLGTEGSGYNLSKFSIDLRDVAQANLKSMGLSSLEYTKIFNRQKGITTEDLIKEVLSGNVRSRQMTTDNWQTVLEEKLKEMLMKTSIAPTDLNKTDWVNKVSSNLAKGQFGKFFAEIADNVNKELMFENENKNFQTAYREMQKDIFSNYFKKHNIDLDINDIWKNYTYEDFFKTHSELEQPAFIASTKDSSGKTKLSTPLNPTSISVDVNESTIQEIINKIRESLKKESFEIGNINLNEENSNTLISQLQDKINSSDLQINLNNFNIEANSLASVINTIQENLNSQLFTIKVDLGLNEESGNGNINWENIYNENLSKYKDFYKNIKEKYHNDKEEEYDIKDFKSYVSALSLLKTPKSETGESLKQASLDKLKQFLDYYQNLQNIIEIGQNAGFNLEKINNDLFGEKASINNLNNLKQYLKEAQDLYRSATSKDYISPYSIDTSQLAQTNTDATNETNNAFSNLLEKINEVQNAINEKTNAIIGERDTMSNAVGEEMATLELLKNSIQDISDLLNNGDFKIKIDTSIAQNALSNLGNTLNNVENGNYADAGTSLANVLRLIQQAEIVQNETYQERDGAGHFQENHERGFLFNTKTGKYTNPFIAGAHDSIYTVPMAEKAGYSTEDYNAKWHSHPDNIATFSEADINNTIRAGYDYIYAQAAKEIAEFDIKGFLKSRGVDFESYVSREDYMDAYYYDEDLKNILDGIIFDVRRANDISTTNYASVQTAEILKDAIAGKQGNIFSDIYYKDGFINTGLNNNLYYEGITTWLKNVKGDMIFRKDYEEEELNKALMKIDPIKEESILSYFSDYFANLTDKQRNNYIQGLNPDETGYIDITGVLHEISFDAMSSLISNYKTQISDLLSSNTIDDSTYTILSDYFDSMKNNFELMKSQYAFMNDIETKNKLFHNNEDDFQYYSRESFIQQMKLRGYDDIENYHKIYSLEDFIRQNPQYTISESVNNSNENIGNETNEFNELQASAINAAEAKRDFVKANESVLTSTETSIPGIEEEETILEELKNTMLSGRTDFNEFIDAFNFSGSDFAPEDSVELQAQRIEELIRTLEILFKIREDLVKQGDVPIEGAFDSLETFDENLVGGIHTLDSLLFNDDFRDKMFSSEELTERLEGFYNKASQFRDVDIDSIKNNYYDLLTAWESRIVNKRLDFDYLTNSRLFDDIRGIDTTFDEESINGNIEIDATEIINNVKNITEAIQKLENILTVLHESFQKVFVFPEEWSGGEGKIENLTEKLILIKTELESIRNNVGVGNGSSFYNDYITNNYSSGLDSDQFNIFITALSEMYELIVQVQETWNQGFETKGLEGITNTFDILAQKIDGIILKIGSLAETLGKIDASKITISDDKQKDKKDYTQQQRTLAKQIKEITRTEREYQQLKNRMNNGEALTSFNDIYKYNKGKALREDLAQKQKDTAYDEAFNSEYIKSLMQAKRQNEREVNRALQDFNVKASQQNQFEEKEQSINKVINAIKTLIDTELEYQKLNKDWNTDKSIIEKDPKKMNRFIDLGGKRNEAMNILSSQEAMGVSDDDRIIDAIIKKREKEIAVDTSLEMEEAYQKKVEKEEIQQNQFKAREQSINKVIGAIKTLIDTELEYQKLNKEWDTDKNTIEKDSKKMNRFIDLGKKRNEAIAVLNSQEAIDVSDDDRVIDSIIKKREKEIAVDTSLEMEEIRKKEAESNIKTEAQKQADLELQKQIQMTLDFYDRLIATEQEYQTLLLKRKSIGLTTEEQNKMALLERDRLVKTLTQEEANKMGLTKEEAEKAVGYDYYVNAPFGKNIFTSSVVQQKANDYLQIRDNSEKNAYETERLNNILNIINEIKKAYVEYSALITKQITNNGFLDTFDLKRLNELKELLGSIINETDGVNSLSTALNNLINSGQGDTKTINASVNGMNKYFEAIDETSLGKLYESYGSTEKEYQKLVAKQVYTKNLDTESSGLTVNEQNELIRLEAKRSLLLDEINKREAMSVNLSAELVQKRADLVSLESSYAKSYNEAWQNKKGDELQTPYDQINELQRLVTMSDGKYIATDEYKTKLSDLRKEADSLKETLKTIDYGNPESVENFNKSLDNLKIKVKDAKNELKNFESKDATKLMRNIAQFLEKNHGISEESRNALQEYYKEIEDGSNLSIGRIKELGQAVTEIIAKETMAGNVGMTFFDTLNQRAKGLLATLMTYVSFYRIIGYIKQGFGIFKEFDSALAEMQKVSNETISTLKEFQQTSFDLADSIGTDALSLQQSVAEFMRLGQTLDEATDSAQAANILFNVSEFESAKDASTALIAMSQAYDELSNTQIIDVINKLGNDFPISTEGLATALQDGAASLTTAGNDFYEAAALVTAGNRITQDPSKVGKAMRTIALRLTGTEASAEELEADGEEVEGMIKNVSKLRDVVMQATKVDSNNNKGIDILNDVGAYKSTYDILLEIAEIYDEIVEKDKQYGTKQANLLLETIAGKNRASIAASILQSPEMLKEAYAEATDAEGSAAIENEKYMDSVEGHLVKLKNAWEELWANVSTREFVNGVIDLGTGILEIVNNLGLVKSALLAIGALDIIKWMTSNSDGKKGSLFNGFINSLRQFNTKGGIKGLLSGGVEGAVKGSTGAVIQNVEEATATEVLEEALSGAAGDSVVEGTKEGIFKGLASSGIGKIVGNIGSSITSLLPIVGYLAAIAGIIGTGYVIFKGISKAIDKANFSLKETREEAKALVSDYQTSQKNSNANKAKADELSDRYVELSKGVNLSNNQNLTLTNEEYSEYLSICNDIANMYPRLVSGYDAQGNAILKLKGNVEQLTEAYKQEQMTAARTLIQGGENGEDARSIWDDFQNYKTLEKPIDDREKELLDSILSSPNAKGEVNRILGNPDYNTSASYNQPTTEKEIQEAFAREKLIELGFSINMDDASFDETMNKLKTLTEETEMDAEIIYQQMKTMGQSFAVANEKYWDLDETQQGFITSAINGMDKETLLGLKSYEDYYSQISNLVDSANNAFISNESVFDEQWQNILNQDGLDLTIDNYENSLNKLEELGYKQEDIIDLINQDTVKVGNVNLSADRSINWGEDPTKNKNFANLQTWYDESAEELAKEFKNTTSTVLGTSDVFTFGDNEEIELSFAMITEDGEVLSSETVYDYINNIINTANKNNEPITIDTILKYDSDVENGGMNIIAGKGEEASYAMHEIEILKGYGNVEGVYKTLDNLAQKTGKSIDDFITEYYKLGNLKDINTFRDVYADMLNLGSGKGNLANAKTMKEFQGIADFYRQVFVDQFKEEIGEDASIDLFNSIFDDQGRSDLTKGFSDILKQKWLLDPNSPEYQKYMEQFENYSYDEAKAYANAFSKIGSLSDAEIQQEFSKGLRDIAAGAYQATLNIEEETAAINSLNSAMASSNGATGMSTEEVTNVEALYKDLVGYDASELFESTANGIHLNQKELRRLNKEYQKSKVKQQSKQYDELQKRLSESEKALYDLQQQYSKKPTDDLRDEINAENRRKEGIEENINALEREMAQYSALTSAYNQYVNAQSSANENAKYENIQTGYDTAKDLIERGWGGQDDVRAYVNMFTQEDMMTAPVDEVIAKFNELNKIIPNTSYSMKDFFTVDGDGKSTSTGVFNFLDVVKDKFKATAKTMEDYENFSDEEINAIADKLVTITDDGRYSFDFDILGGDQKVADMLGVDISLLQAIIQAAQDAGFEVQMSNALPGIDATTQHISEMRQELIDLGVEADKINEYNFAPEIEKIELDTKLDDDKKIEQYTELAKKIQEAKEAMKLDESLSPEQQAAGLEYLNAQLDSTIQKATQIKMQATFGSLDISSWQADYQVLGTLMQDYYEKSSELAIRREIGLDCSDATKSCDEAKDALAEYLAEVYSAEQLREMGFDLELGFDDLGTKEKITELKKQLEQDDFKLEIDPTFTDPTGDPTKGLDNQHIVIEVQFTTNGETVAIEEVHSFEKEADEAARPREATLTTNAKVATEEIQETNKELDKTDSKDPNATIKCNAPKVSGDVSVLNKNLSNTSGTRTANIVVNGLNSAVTATGNLLNNFNKLANKTVTSTINTVKNTFFNTFGNKPPFNGTAHNEGTISKFTQRNAYVNGTYSGDWGVPQDEDALVNELGEEIIIHDGKWRIANNGNMGFTHLRKGDVVLNHKQTEELLKNGYVSNSRAKLVGGMSHVDGTIGDAFSKGSTVTNGVKRPTPKKTSSGKTSSNNSGKSSGNNNSNKSNNNSNNNTAETFDWVEVKIQRIEEAIAQLDSIIDSVYNTWDTRNNNLNKDLVKVGEEIDLQKRAIETYNNYLNKIGLSQTYINKIKKGELKIEDIKDDKLKEKIQKYQEYYNKVVQCQTSITELKEREKELVAQRFDNYQTWYEERLQDLDFRIEMMETLSDRAEESGRLMSGYYAGIMRDTEEARIKVLQREYNQLVLELEQATNSNTIAKWSEQWYEMCASIDEVSQAIAEAENNIIEYQNTIREYEWERFDKTLDRIGQIADETEWLNELLEEGKSFEEETGRYTELGSARMGLFAIQYDTYLNESARYAAELKNIEKELSKKENEYNQDLLDRRNELLEAQRDAISNALKERDAIKSLIEEGIEAQLNALQKLIDKYKEALQSQKDLYDYQNNVTESADEISRLQKLISAYQGDDSEESRLKVQQYQKELKDAQKSLYDTQYDRNISDTEEALDKLYEQYEETLNKALDDVDKLIGDVIKGVNLGSKNIVDTIKEAADKYGYTLTDSMSTIVSSINKLVSEDIKKNISSSDTGHNNAPNSGVDTASNNISQNVNRAVQDSFDKAKEEYEKGKATSIIKKNFLSNDRKSYTDAEGNKIEFTRAVAKGEDDFVNDTKGNQYYFDEGGNLVGYGGGLQTIHGFKYYTDRYGALQTGWQEIGGKTYYFYKSTIPKYTGKNGDHYKGVAATGWQNIDGETYYFDKSGVMQTGRWKDRKIGDKKYYRYWLKDNGKAFKNTSAKIGKTTYYFDKNGYLLDKKGGKPKVFTTLQYKTGVYGITQDQLAWTQENKKEEAIIRPSDGAILTPLSHGDSVLNAKATKALFEFANNPDEYFKSYTDGSNYNDVPTINNTMNGDMNIQFNINGANITDYDTFKKQLTSDPQFERLLRSMTTDRLFGGSSLKKYKI